MATISSLSGSASPSPRPVDLAGTAPAKARPQAAQAQASSVRRDTASISPQAKALLANEQGTPRPAT